MVKDADLRTNLPTKFDLSQVGFLQRGDIRG